MVPTVKHIYDNVNALSALIKKNLHQRYLSLRLDTNNRCNLRCKYCYTLSHKKEPFKIMTIDEFKKIADELFSHSYNVYLSCAWEPLVNKHFVEYIDIAARYSLPSLNFITNGVLFNDEIIRASIKAPVHQIDISIDAANKTSYKSICGRDCFNRVIANLRRISELKKEHRSVYPRVGIVFTVFEQNSSEVPSFIEQFSKWCDHIQVNHLLPKVRNEFNPYTRLSEVDFYALVRRCELTAKGRHIALDYSINTKPKRTLLCRTGIQFILICSNGKVCVCNGKAIGNVFSNSFEEIVHDNKRLLRTLCFGKDDYCQKECDMGI